MFEYVAVLLVLAVVGYLIFQPLWRAKAIEGLSPQNKEIREKALQKSKEDVYAAIKEMEFDYGMGKISEEDYKELRSEYKSRALQILKELDNVDRPEDMESAIEKEVLRLRNKKGTGKKRRGTKKTAFQMNFCPNCGRKVGPNDNFCQGCGMKLILPEGRV